MKNLLIKIAATIVFQVISSSYLFSQPLDNHTNQIIIRNDRVFILNGQPFFPIGVCYELGENAYNAELKNYGFNFINLFQQNNKLYNYWVSKNVISGDINISSEFSTQYNDILSAYWDKNLTGPDNYERIKNYLDDGVYLLSDDLPFCPDDASHWEWNNPPYRDSITLNPPFNQQLRNLSIDRINNLAAPSADKSKIIGYYSDDDANMFQTSPQLPIWYYNNYRNSRIQNFQDSYNHARSVYPNSMVLMSLPPCFFPRIFDPENPLWNTSESARDLWVNDAIEFSKGANVLFSPGYITMEYPSWGTNWRIYDDGYPKWYPQHIKETLIDRVLSTASVPKAILGGVIFDTWQSNPLWNDPKLNDKVKWEIYAGLEKGATGLIFFGWHKKDTDFIDPNTGQRVYYRPIWDAIRHQVDTLVNIKHLDSVFTKTNFGQTGYTLSSETGKDVSYAVYKNDNSWNDYYLLVTNNPNGSLFGPDEGNNNIMFTCNAHNLNNYSVKEVFSGNSVQVTSQNSFSYILPWFGTAMFHISNSVNSSIIPNNFYLNQNYPNPFNPVTLIKFGINKDAFVTINVYNVLGQLLKTLVNENKSAGEYQVSFDGTNYASGLYLYKIKAGNFEQTKKMLIIM